jgi:hypothetical protein
LFFGGFGSGLLADWFFFGLFSSFSLLSARFGFGFFLSNFFAFGFLGVDFLALNSNVLVLDFRIFD